MLYKFLDIDDVKIEEKKNSFISVVKILLSIIGLLFKKNIDDSFFYKIVGGTSIAGNYENGLHFELKPDLMLFLYFNAKRNALHIIKNFTDKDLVGTNALASKKLR